MESGNHLGIYWQTRRATVVCLAPPGRDRKVLDCFSVSVEDQADNQAQTLADYIVDERFRMRKHVTIFVDGKPLVDRDEMSDPVGATSDIYVLQALSGG